MEEHGKIAADRSVAEFDELLRVRADHHPVAFGDREPEQLIADCAAYQIDLHGAQCTALQAGPASTMRWYRIPVAQ